MAADPQKLKISKNQGIGGIGFCLARVPESSQLYFGSSDAQIYGIDLQAEKPEPQKFEGAGHESYVTGLARVETALVSGSYDGQLIWWDQERRQPIRTIAAAHDRWIRRVVASPDQKQVASVADDMLCKIWDAGSGDLIHTLTDHKPLTPHNYPSMLYACGYSPDGKYLATADKVGHIVVWDAQAGTKLAELEAPVMYTWDPKQRRHSIGGIRSVAFSHDSKKLAVGGIGTIGNIDHLGGPARVEVFDWQAGSRLLEIEDSKFKGLVEQLQFHESDEWFLAAGGDHAGFVTFFKSDDGKVLHQDKAPMHVHGFAFSESWETLYAVGHGKIVSWELAADSAGEEKA